jgi:beta-glucosidase
MSLSQTELGVSDTLQIRCDVSNEGSYAGDEVVQLYIAPQDSHIERAQKELKAFTRVTLAPGETATVQLSLPVESLAYYDTTNGWIVEKIDYKVIVARHSDDPDALQATIRVI